MVRYERLERFKLQLHPDKTRFIRFGRFAAEKRELRGQVKPETFGFLGFTHICGLSRKGGFVLLRHTIAKRQQAKLFPSTTWGTRKPGAKV